MRRILLEGGIRVSAACAGKNAKKAIREFAQNGLRAARLSQ